MNTATARLATESMVSDPSRRCDSFVGLYGATSMTKKTYFEKLKDPRWQKKRLEALESSNWSCEVCCDGEKTLHVHHKIYIQGHEPWEYHIQQLSVLCEDCHETEHEDSLFMDVLSRLPMAMPEINQQTIALVVAGSLGMEVPIESVWEEACHTVGLRLSDAIYAECERIKQRGGN